MSKCFAFLLILGAPGVALALPPVGATRADVTMEDSWERTEILSQYDGKPMLVLYEDRGSGQQNAEFKKELADVAQDGRYKGIVTFVPVADTSSYDYWPVRGFARRSVQKQSLATHTNIMCDWKGAIREALQLTRDTSNVVLYDKAGKVVFAHAGAMSAEQRATLFALLKVQVDAATR